MEKAPDTESDFLQKVSRAKQAMAGTAEVGGQRRGHPELMSAKTLWQYGLTSPPVICGSRGRESRNSQQIEPTGRERPGNGA